jgi:hypothetical protein
VLDPNAEGAAAEEIVPAASPMVADVGDEESVLGASGEVRRWHGRLVVLDTRAAVQLIGEDATVHEREIDVWERT